MTVDRTTDYLLSLLNELRNLPHETGWVEFKHNNAEPEVIGEYISALAASAALLGKVSAWMVWGVDDSSHDIVGTSFDAAQAKVGG